ncbi:MAG: transcription antitermination factor NusB [Clostridia bacterium]|nr:transcription antitermination factor NusB [Clostridia bacterium]
MSRKVARESVYKLVFEYLFSKKPNRRTFDILSSAELADVDKKYMLEAYGGIMEKYDTLIAEIEELSEGFSLERIFMPDLAALLLALYEMHYMPDIPHSVSIAEAVELVKRYSTDKSNQYVNGVLSSVYKKLNKKDLDENANN